MNIPTDLIAKGTAGALVAAAAIGTGIAAKNSGWFGASETVEVNLTKFDEKLIEWLETEGNDIVFGVRQSPYSYNISSFPEVKKDNVQEKEIEIYAEIFSDSENIKKSGTADISTLKDLNKGHDKWTWICVMDFKKEESEYIEVEETQRNRVIGSSGDKGLFKKLMKDISTNNDDAIRNLKKDFIKKCAKERRTEENKTIDSASPSADKEVKNSKPIEFVFKKGEANASWGTDTNKLYFGDKDKFDKWFPESAAK